MDSRESCINNCGKECCTRGVRIEATVCPVCEETVTVWELCTDKGCNHVFDIHTRRKSLQICMDDCVCMYICKVECVPGLQSISAIGIGGIKRNGNSYIIPFVKLIPKPKGENT